MKAILEFDFPEEEESFNDALKGTEYLVALDDMDNWLRGLAKYADETHVSIEDARAKLREFRGVE